MFVFSARSLLGILSLLIVASIAKAEEPPRSCVDTGIMCIESCIGIADGDYQWCGSCQWFVQCSQGITYHQPCPSNLYWNDNVKTCVAVSDTCTECVVDTTPNGATQTTIPMTTVIANLCNNTGVECISHCDITHNGVYQWCARCDYFLLCSGSEEYYMACQPDLEYDHTVEACVFNSTTCSQCYDPFATTTKFDPCSSLPCLNGGTCSSNGNGFTCSCPDSHTGYRCETPTNPCDSFPCLNGGTCIDLGNGMYTCSCPIDQTGTRCESNYNPCDSLPCLNGGTCIDLGNGMYTCSCPIDQTGTRCESNYNPCDSFPCLNGGTCIDLGNGMYTCSCPIDQTGTRCESTTSPCDSFPCLNGGTCIDNGNTFTCSCSIDHTGEICETSSPCDSQPCLNGGSCNWLGGIYFSCLCPIEWTGAICESGNYNETLTCGTELHWAEYPASNDFTRLCYFSAPLSDPVGRATECRDTVQGIPLYNDATGLLQAGGNFGCLVSQDYPDDLPATSIISCNNDYQHDVSLGNFTESAHLMVCLRYPYDGIPRV